VTPPVSSSKPSGGTGTVKPLDYVGWDGSCVKSDIGTDKGSGCSPKNLQDKADALEEQVKRETDEKKRIELMEKYTLLQARLVDLREYGKTNVSAFKALERIYNSPLYNSAPPKLQLHFTKDAQSKLGSGQWGGQDLKLLAGAFETFKFDSNGQLKCILKPVECQELKPNNSKPNNSGSNSGNSTSTNSNTSYTDLSVGLSAFLGFSAGFLINNDGSTLLYGGPTLGTPGISGGVTVSGNTATPGCFWQWSASLGFTLTMGASGPSNSDNFAEVGLTVPGANVQVACALQIRPPNPPVR
jgi:hypothetical protein